MKKKYFILISESFLVWGNFHDVKIYTLFSLQERLILELRLNVLIFFLRFEADNVLKMFLNYMVYTICISVNQCERDEETYQSVLPAEICYQELLIMTNRDVCQHC